MWQHIAISQVQSYSTNPKRKTLKDYIQQEKVEVFKRTLIYINLKIREITVAMSLLVTMALDSNKSLKQLQVSLWITQHFIITMLPSVYQ
jgi:hypothetical protein